MSKKIMNLVLVVLAFIFALVLALYLFLDMKSDYVLAELIKQIEQKSGAKFEFEEKPQVKIFPKLTIILGESTWGKDNLILSFQHAKLEVDTLGLLLGKIKVGTLEIENSSCYYKDPNSVKIEDLAKSEDPVELINQTALVRAETMAHVAAETESYFTQFKLDNLILKNVDLYYATDFEPKYGLSIQKLELKDFAVGNLSELVMQAVILTENGNFNLNVKNKFILHKDFIEMQKLQAFVSSIGERYFKSELSIDGQFTYNFLTTTSSVGHMNYSLAGMTVTGAGTCNIRERKADLSININGNALSLLQDCKIAYIPKNPSALSDIQAKIQLSMNDNSIIATKNGSIDGTTFSSKAEVIHVPFSVKNYVILGDINLTDYMPVEAKTSANTNSTEIKANHSEPNVEILAKIKDNLNLDLGFKIANLKYKDLHLDSIDVTFKGNKGLFSSNSSANIFNGQVQTFSNIDLVKDKVQTKVQINSCEIANIAQETLGSDKLSGFLNAKANLEYKISRPLATMSGVVELLAQPLIINYKILPPEINLNTPKLNEFDSLTIRADILDGQAYLMPISLQSAQLRIDGKGQIGLLDRKADIRLKLNVPELPEFPMKIVGIIPNLKYGVDQEELAKSAAQKLLDTSLDSFNKLMRDGQRKLNDAPSPKENMQNAKENLGKGLEELGAGLKGLLRRQ